MKILGAAVNTEDQLTKAIGQLEDEPSTQDIERIISPIISDDRVILIKRAFSIETYRMKFVKTNGQWIVQFRRGDEEFRSDINLTTIENVDWALLFQWASIVVEIFMLVLSALGIAVDLSKAQMRAITNEVMEIVRKPAFLRALEEFKDAWSKGGAWKRAKAIFFLLKDTYSLGFFWKIIKLLFTTMTWFEEARALAECAVMIVAAFATDGLALIARIALSIDSAAALIQKLVNIKHFTEYRKTLE